MTTARTAGLRERGFTLLELVVVIAVFSIMAAMAYGGLTSVLHARSHIEAVLDRTQALQRAYWVLRDDFNNGVWRPVRDGDTSAESALILFNSDADNASLQFTRLGWSNPMDLPRSTLERVGYALQGTRLVRRQWPELDRTPQTEPSDATLLDGVNAVAWRFLDASMKWHTQWPEPAPRSRQPGANDNPALAPPPRMVEMRLETADWGEIVLEFAFGAVRPLSNRT